MLHHNTLPTVVKAGLVFVVDWLALEAAAELHVSITAAWCMYWANTYDVYMHA